MYSVRVLCYPCGMTEYKHEQEKVSDTLHAASVSGREVAPRCPDGSWSKWMARRCLLPMGHTGPHRYETKLVPQFEEVVPRGR
jgi:hypothetical protein